MSGGPIQNSTKKKRGRPRTTGKGTLIGVRMHAVDLAFLDAWIGRRPGGRLSRPEAIRQLVAEALARK
ncbi:MAG: hypothetical protein ACHQAY_27455 [Hyphomicrobiales bacterium]